MLFNDNKNNEKVLKDKIIVFLENKRINIKNEEDKWKIDYKFEKEDKYKIKIIFKNKIDDLSWFFNGCSSLYSIDFSNFNTSHIINMEGFFNECNKLKEIKRINI